ncbi:PTS sugar transporter subunit IIA [Devosia sp. 66-22]|jgi:PTS system nitrogen regulatory IIA component|uniref:PTS sugar transporter subunit IIA n=1 Tax=Devosia sp. 66-22 TaxID=1895753 RepID=UPI00092B3487|nr:PTS sugar transporter subunit IIA [Devosia sp. 66-22]OJX49282.1 MAG: transcriptional regulator [Devosia sp. 66-22]
MDLADILSEESVLFCTDIKTKREVLERLATRAAAATGFTAEEIFAALNDREALGSTGLGNGIAVPHGRFPGLKGVVAVFMKLSVPVDFESVDDQPVDLVMMLLAPVGAGADHLKALARVARVLRTDSVAESLRRANDPKRLYAILTQPLETTKAA